MEAVKQVKTEESIFSPHSLIPSPPPWEEESGNETTAFNGVGHIVDLDNQRWLWKILSASVHVIKELGV